MRRTALLTACALWVGCRTAPARPDLPAVLVDPNPRSRAELMRAMSAALDGVPVTLADDALTRESTVLLERGRHRDEGGRPAQGREMGKPERFFLVKSGADCVLVHERTGKRFTLLETACSPID